LAPALFDGSRYEVGLGVGREIQIRAPGWLSTGTGSFHDILTARPLVKVLPADGQDMKVDTPVTALSAS